MFEEFIHNSVKVLEMSEITVSRSHLLAYNYHHEMWSEVGDLFAQFLGSYTCPVTWQVIYIILPAYRYQVLRFHLYLNFIKINLAS